MEAAWLSMCVCVCVFVCVRRSGYAEAVATCAGRMAEVLRGNSATNIRYALEPSRMSAAHPTQGVRHA